MWLLWRYYQSWYVGVVLLALSLLTAPAIGLGPSFDTALVLVATTAALRGWAHVAPGGRWGRYVQRQRLN